MTAVPERAAAIGVEEVIRELVRAEVRAELSRALAARSPTPQLVSAADYAKARAISLSTVRNAIRSGRLPAVRIGSSVRIASDQEFGRPVVVTARPNVSPTLRAEQILAAKAQRDARKVATGR